MDRYWLLLLPAITFAQVTASDYDRALKTRTRYENLVIGAPGPATWIGDTDQFWYRFSRRRQPLRYCRREDEQERTRLRSR
jgi:hypothetical protein